MGDFLTTPIKTKDSFDDENSFIRFGSSAMQGWRYRMEDAHIHTLNNSHYDIFGIFDGHGGKEVAQFVKNHFIEEFNNNQNTKLENISESLIETFLKMDELMKTEKGKKELKELYLKSKQEDTEQNKKTGNKDIYQCFDPKNENSDIIGNITGCTACVVVIDQKNKKIYFANAGDSRAVICKKGIGFQMSHDHKPDNAKEKNRVYKSGGWVNEGRIKGNLNLSRSIGDLEYKNNEKINVKEQMITAYPEINIEKIDDNVEFIIIGCDGIWDCLSPQEACDKISVSLYDSKSGNMKNVKISGVIEKMMDSIISDDINNENGIGCDNMSCIVVQFKNSKNLNNKIK